MGPAADEPWRHADSSAPWRAAYLESGDTRIDRRLHRYFQDRGIACRSRCRRKTAATAGDVLGSDAGWEDRHLQIARRRQLARWQALHVRRRAIHGAGALEEIPELRHTTAAVP